jgi:hypothetical protein
MVLFQPSGPATVWDLSYYFGSGKPAEIVLWIIAIVAIIFTLLLISSWLETRKPEHLYWGISFALLWITTHLTIFSGTYAKLLEPVPAAFGGLTVGLFAVGLFKNVKPESELFGKILLYYVLVMAILIGFFKLENLQTAVPIFSSIVPVVVMALHIPSAILIIVLPLMTRSENGASAIIMSVAGIIMSLVGVLLALATVVGNFVPLFASEGFLATVFRYFPFVYLAAALCFAWGTFVPKRWNFTIPGIELE